MLQKPQNKANQFNPKLCPLSLQTKLQKVLHVTPFTLLLRKALHGLSDRNKHLIGIAPGSLYLATPALVVGSGSNLFAPSILVLMVC